MKESNVFSKEELIRILNAAVDKTLEEVDVNNVFAKTVTKPKITGIAGDVIEQSVLGYPADSDQRPDLNIDGTLTELKTTGMRRKGSGSSYVYEAKEPASITAVSIGSIEDEEFFSSSFWHKIEHLLFVFYEYESEKTVPAAGYKDFHIRGYSFHTFEGEDLEIIKSDWQLIHDFLYEIRERCTKEEAKLEYPNLSTFINKETVYLDTAPKYPHPPRFRIRRRVVSSIIQKAFNGESFEKLADSYSSYDDVIKKCSNLTQLYRGFSMYELLRYFGLDLKPDQKVSKQYAEQVVVRMFGGSAKKLSKIEMFNKFGIIGKSITLSKTGARTEDTKLFRVNFDELTEREIYDEELGCMREKAFEDSELYSYLHDNKFLFFVFQEVPSDDGKVSLGNNIFLGFKFLDLDTEDIIASAKKSWEEARNLIFYNEFTSKPMYTKEGVMRYTPKTGIPMEETNFPKSKDNTIFFRGSATDATYKKPVNGVNVIAQEYWIKGRDLVDILKETPNIREADDAEIENQRREMLHIIKNLSSGNGGEND